MTLKGETIRRLRHELNLTQIDLGIEVGIDTDLIGKIENNHRKQTSLYIAFKLAEFFKCKIEDLL